jgi:hypothetical protein
MSTIEIQSVSNQEIKLISTNETSNITSSRASILEKHPKIKKFIGVK